MAREMTAENLLKTLAGDYTGKNKIAKAKKVLATNPAMTAAELVDYMDREEIWPEGTLAKAKELLGGVRPMSGQGNQAPPGGTAAGGKQFKGGEFIPLS